MSKFQMWWWVKGEEKTKKIIGRTCRLFFFTCLGFIFVGAFVVGILTYGWIILAWLGVAILFILITYAAIFWGDK